jgi:hypothetical protein
MVRSAQAMEDYALDGKQSAEGAKLRSRAVRAPLEVDSVDGKLVKGTVRLVFARSRANAQKLRPAWGIDVIDCKNCFHLSCCRLICVFVYSVAGTDIWHRTTSHVLLLCV